MLRTKAVNSLHNQRKMVNNKYLKVIIVLILFGWSNQIIGQTNEIINTFFDEYKKDISISLSNLFSTNPAIDRGDIAYINLKKDLVRTAESLGGYNGYELISTHSAGKSKSLIIYSYLLKYQNQPMRFMLTMYKPDDQWMIYNFQYDLDLNEELIKSSQLHYLQETFNHDKR